MRPRNVIAFAGLLAGLLCLIAGIIGTADLLNPKAGTSPREIDAEDKLPSIMPFVSTRVSLTGNLRIENGRAYLTDAHRQSFGPGLAWFADCQREMVLTGLPPGFSGDQLITVTGALSAAPLGTGGTPVLTASLAVDAVHCDSYNTPEKFRLREWLDSASQGILLILLLLLPLWLRLFIQLLPQRSGKAGAHHCPCCGYDCRGSPLRCPECGSPVQAPNMRLDLNPRAGQVK